MDLESLLLAESRKKMNVSACKSAAELLANVFSPTGNRVSDEELELIAAAGSDQGRKRPLPAQR